jgi:hypothetical protein
MTVCWGIRSRKMVNVQSKIHKFVHKKTAYNEVHMYCVVPCTLSVRWYHNALVDNHCYYYCYLT